jgi:hypothetical protein
MANPNDYEDDVVCIQHAKEVAEKIKEITDIKQMTHDSGRRQGNRKEILRAPLHPPAGCEPTYIERSCRYISVPSTVTSDRMKCYCVFTT